ncbi:MAG TPA: hypothetical protein VGI39_23980 [Polyangiaceae bacterium]|jgi:hypothetical protein
MNTLERQVVDSTLGLVGGVVATAILQQGMKASSKLPESMRPEAPERDPGDYIVEQGERVMKHPLSEEAHRTTAKLAHYAYGATWGAALGLAFGATSAPMVRDPKMILAGGAAMGAVVWSVGFLGWLPAAGLTHRVTEQKPGAVASGLASHILYGVLAAAPVALRAALMPARPSFFEMMRKRFF